MSTERLSAETISKTVESVSSSDVLLICTSTQCTKDNDDDSLSCADCQRSVHYRCTMLPAYQIQVIKSMKEYQYFCQNCVDVPKDLLELVPRKQRSQPSIKTELEVEKLRRDNAACKGLLQQNQIEKEELKQMLKQRGTDLKELKDKLQNGPGLHTLEYVEDKFEKKLETLKQTLEEAIQEGLQTAKRRSYADATVSKSDTKQTVTSRSLKEAIKDAWKEEEAEEYDKMKRIKNVIIHGLPEQPSNEDLNWATTLLQDTHAHANIKRVSRIGKANTETNRPLLISLKNENEKLALLGNLSALRDYEKYKGISVTEDLTIEERKLLKTLSLEAKERNKDEKSGTWRVRGSSKNGFYLMKTKKGKQNQNQMNNETKTKIKK